MPEDKKTLPAVAVTCGDPCGIGPEVALAACLDERVRAACAPVLFWPRDLPSDGIDAVAVEGGGSSAGVALASLEAAIGAVEGGSCRALVTAPVSKARMAALVPGFRGHTDWLARRAGLRPRDVVMIFSGRRVRTACVTRHVPIRDLASLLEPGDVAWAALLLWAHLRFDLDIEAPRLAVCGLNPHASEGGLVGGEEADIVAPAVGRVRRAVEAMGESPLIEGPLAADASFRDHVAGLYDGVLGMFHDQATIAAKIADPFRSVNYTAGLPFVRTSPDHGTADGLAGKDRADPGSMIEAVLLAARLASRSDGIVSRLESLASLIR